MDYQVVIPAAGTGSRMKAGKNKQFIELAGLPVIVHTLRVFERDDRCQGITLVVNKQDEAEFERILAVYPVTKVVRLVIGGKERQESVYNGLKSLETAKIVLIHDGARPFITELSIRQLVAFAKDSGAAVLAVPVKDTIKSASDLGFVSNTLHRSSLWAVQTPQAFHYSVILDAHKQAISDQFIGTDDASLVERLGKKVYIVEGDYQNIKLTTMEDLIFAKAILDNRQKRM